MNQIIIPNTSATVVLEEYGQTLSVGSSLFWDFKTEFVKDDAEITLDGDGDLFEVTYSLSLEAVPRTKTRLMNSSYAKEFAKEVAEIHKIFSFIEENKKNFFDSLGFKGVLE